MELPKSKWGRKNKPLLPWSFYPLKSKCHSLCYVPFTPLKFQGLQHYFWLLGAELGLEYSLPISSYWTLTWPGLLAKVLDYEISGVGVRVRSRGP